MRLRQLQGEKERQAWQSRGKVTPGAIERMLGAWRKACALRDLGAYHGQPRPGPTALRALSAFTRVFDALWRFAERVLGPRRQSAEPVCSPGGDRVGKPVHEALVDLEAQRRIGKLLGIANENAALPKQPQSTDDRLLVRGAVRQKATNQGGCDGKERCHLPSHEFTKDRTRLECFPVEDAHIFAELVASRHRPQLPAYKSPQRRVAREGVGVLRRIVVLHQRAQCRLQNRAIKPFLAAEMVID